MSLHIGVNLVDKTHYWKNEFDSWDGQLLGCEADAEAMEQLAKAQGFTTKKLLTQDATRANVIQQIEQAAAELKAGDYFFLTYSGHGSQVKDISRDEFENNDLSKMKIDSKDETWCLYDKQLIDDELHRLWTTFKKGVRILIFSDSCHSGTVSKTIGDEMPIAPPGIGFRMMPKSGLTVTYMKHAEFYDSLQSEQGANPSIDARVVLISGCQDDELSREDQSPDSPGGLFTKSMVKAWKFGGFSNHHDLFQMVQAFLKDTPQNPNYHAFGNEEDTTFETSKPLVLR